MEINLLLHTDIHK